MSWKQCEPGGLQTVPAQGFFQHGKSYRSDRWTQPFCELHNRNLVDDLPLRCLLGTANPLTALGQLRDLGYRADDCGDAVELWGRADICGKCIDANLGHPTVRRLRREQGVSA